MKPGYDFVMWSVLSVNFANRTLKTDVMCLGTDHLTSSGGGGVMFFFLKKYSDFGGGKENNLMQSFCHIT